MCKEKQSCECAQSGNSGQSAETKTPPKIVRRYRKRSTGEKYAVVQFVDKPDVVAAISALLPDVDISVDYGKRPTVLRLFLDDGAAIAEFEVGKYIAIDEDGGVISYGEIALNEALEPVPDEEPASSDADEPPALPDAPAPDHDSTAAPASVPASAAPEKPSPLVGDSIITLREKLSFWRSRKIVQAAKISSIENGALHLEGAGWVDFSFGFLQNHNPQVGGYIVIYADDYISYSHENPFEEGYTLETEPTSFAGKTLHNSDVSGARQNVKDIKVVGNGDTFRLLCKASSQKEGWMKSSKALEIPGIGCLVQVTTQQRNLDGSYAVAEALAFVPDVRIVEDENNGRKLIASNRPVPGYSTPGGV